jgi:ABC-type nitrate/sulfonate/bicarbonate transport system permease component
MLVAGVLLGLWSWGASRSAGPAGLPSPVAVAEGIWADRSLYAVNLPATLEVAAAGYALGAGAGISVAVLLAQLPRVRSAGTAVVVVLYNVPVIAVAPLLQVLLPGAWPGIVTAALSVFFPVLLGTAAGVTATDPVLVDVVRAAGGGRRHVLRSLTPWSAAPGVLAALAATAPLAVVGAMVGEFLGGRDAGLGVMLVQAMSNLDAARVWGIAVVVSAVGVAAVAAVSVLLDVAAPWAADRGPARTVARLPERVVRRALAAVASAAGALTVVLVVWVGGVWLLDLQPYVVRLPDDVWRHLVAGPDAHLNRVEVARDLGTTLGRALSGTMMGLVAGLVVGVLATHVRGLREVLVPVVVLVSSVPALALVPILALALGRGPDVAVALAALAALLPTVLNVRAGLASAPPALRDVLTATGASGWRRLLVVELPSAVPYLFVALRVALPWAVYGVLFAEWLATGDGMGGEIVRDTIVGDFDSAWSGAVVVSVTSTVLYLFAGVAERAALDRWSPGTGP